MTPRDLETFAVPDALAGERIDRALALLTGWSLLGNRSRPRER